MDAGCKKLLSNDRINAAPLVEMTVIVTVFSLFIHMLTSDSVGGSNMLTALLILAAATAVPWSSRHVAAGDVARPAVGVTR